MNDAQPETTPPRVWIGTSGYSYRDWIGPFYPDGTQAADMLALYAVHFSTVEINYTYYGMPTPRVSAGMVEQTPENFQFFVKAHKTLTHERDMSTAQAFLDGVEPMRLAGKLRGLLFQFPQSFKNTAENRAYIAQVAETFAETPVAIEFRDDSWAFDPVYGFLEKNRLAFVAVDEPEVSTLFPSCTPIATAPTGYVRFHSRNASKWYAGAKARYDYDYSDEELEEWLPVIDTIASKARDVFVFFNNCHGGQAADNASTMREMLRQRGLDCV